MMAANVLDSPLLSVRVAGSECALTLPALIAALLVGDDVEAMTELPAEQRAFAWRLLVRCAAKVLHERCEQVPDAAGRSADALTDMLEETLSQLTGGSDAWALYQANLSRPGFLQVPAEGNDPAALGYKHSTMGRLATTLASKNHERKSGPAVAFAGEPLLYALLEYQFGSVYTKRNYQTQITGSRTGKGSGCPFMGVRLATLGATFRHDVGVMLANREQIAREKGLRGTVWALWVEPWEGTAPLAAKNLDPFFLPLARRIRVAGPDADGRYRTLWFCPTGKERVTDHSEGGDLGDPFVALVPNPKTPERLKVRGVMDTGFGYAEVARLIFGGAGKDAAYPSMSVQALCAARPPEGARIVFEGTAFDQGKSLGFHRRELLVPARCVDDVLEPSAAQQVHAQMLGHCRDAERALAAAVRMLLHGTARPKKGDAPTVQRFTRMLQMHVDSAYPEELFAALQSRRDGVVDCTHAFRTRLVTIARGTYESVVEQLPLPSSRRLELLVRSRAVLERGLAKLFGVDDDSNATQVTTDSGEGSDE